MNMLNFYDLKSKHRFLKEKIFMHKNNQQNLTESLHRSNYINEQIIETNYQLYRKIYFSILFL